MNLKNTLGLFFIAFSSLIFAQESTKVKVYGFVSNDFFYNSRQNVEIVDGIIHLFPKPIELASGKDINDVQQSEMLSVNSRIGISISGTPILGAKSSGIIEGDFAGFGTNYYVFRIRQAFVKLNWDKTELLVGQTWHPLFGNVVPTTFSANAGAPFQAFNRSPQIRFKESLSKSLTFTAAALYEMQFASQGPTSTTSSGASNVFMKNAISPELYVGIESKTKHWTLGVGGDFKTIKPGTVNDNTVSSLSGNAYAHYTNGKFQIKTKTILGQNLSNQLMIGGYGVSEYATDSATVVSYTNFNSASSWINFVYGTKIQVGLLLGVSENLGTSDNLALRKGRKFTTYGFGMYDGAQQILDAVYRIAPQVSYNLPNFKFGVEYDYTTATYGKLENIGIPMDSYKVKNHRILASIAYIF